MRAPQTEGPAWGASRGSLTWVTVCEQGADGQQDLWDGEGGAPVVLQDVQTDHPLAVDVAVVDPGAERHLGNTQVGRDHISYIYIDT